MRPANGKRWFAKPGLLGMLAFNGVLWAGYVWGGWVLHRLEEARRQDIAAYQRYIAQPRPVRAGTNPSEENAARWYRQGMSTAASHLSQADRVALARDFDDLDLLEARFADRCESADPILRASRCSHCDWELTFRRPEPTDPSSMLIPARLLAYCLTRQGAQWAASSGNEAATAYFSALRFAADLRATNLLGNVIGIDVAQVCLAGLGKLVTKQGIAAPTLLAAIDRDLADLAPYVLSVGEGPRVERLEVFALVHDEAKQYEAAERAGLRMLIPRPGVTAYRLSSADKLLRQAAATATIEDPERRSSVATAVRAEAMRSWSPTLRMVGPSDWFRVRQNDDELSDRYRMVQIAVRLEQWHTLHGRYPADVTLLQLPFALGAIRYEPCVERAGYRLHSAAGHTSAHRSAPFVLERYQKPLRDLSKAKSLRGIGAGRP